MKAPGYEEKQTRAFDQEKRVSKVEKKLTFLGSKDAVKYVKQRQADLKKVRGY